MKINWGTKIVILYSSFVIMMLGMVFFAVNQEFHLVTDNYYEEELLFQEQINQKRRKFNNKKIMKTKSKKDV